MQYCENNIGGEKKLQERKTVTSVSGIVVRMGLTFFLDNCYSLF